MEPDPVAGFETARLRLRCLRAADSQSIAALMTPAVGATLASWPAPMSEEMALDRIETARAAAAEGSLLPLAVLRREDTAFLGYVGFALDPVRLRRAKLGYWIGEPYQGHGYAREAVVAAVEAAFALLGVDEIEAAVEVENTASASILRSSGLTLIDRYMVPARGGEHLCDIYRRGQTTERLPDQA